MTAVGVARLNASGQASMCTTPLARRATALPIAAGVFEPAFGFTLRPEIAALTMSGSSIIVAPNAVSLERLRLPERQG